MVVFYAKWFDASSPHKLKILVGFPSGTCELVSPSILLPQENFASELDLNTLDLVGKWFRVLRYWHRGRSTDRRRCLRLVLFYAEYWAKTQEHSDREAHSRFQPFFKNFVY